MRLGLVGKERNGASARSDSYQPDKLSVGSRVKMHWHVPNAKQSVGHTSGKDPTGPTGPISLNFLEAETLLDVWGFVQTFGGCPVLRRDV